MAPVENNSIRRGRPTQPCATKTFCRPYSARTPSPHSRGWQHKQATTTLCILKGDIMNNSAATVWWPISTREHQRRGCDICGNETGRSRDTRDRIFYPTRRHHHQ